MLQRLSEKCFFVRLIGLDWTNGSLAVSTKERMPVAKRPYLLNRICSQKQAKRRIRRCPTKAEKSRTLNGQARVVAPFLLRDKEATPRNTSGISVKSESLGVWGKSKEDGSLKRVKEPEGIEQYNHNQGLYFSKAC